MNDKICEEAFEAIRKKEIKRGTRTLLPIFKSHIDEILRLFETGYAVYDIWELFQEKNAFPGTYETFRRYVKKYIQNAKKEAEPVTGSPASSSVANSTPAFAPTGASAGQNQTQKVKIIPVARSKEDLYKEFSTNQDQPQTQQQRVKFIPVKSGREALLKQMADAGAIPKNSI